MGARGPGPAGRAAAGPGQDGRARARLREAAADAPREVRHDP